MRRVDLLVVAAFAAALAGCVSVTQQNYASDLISPAEAIQSAATAAPRAVPGHYAFRVKAVGSERGKLFLNSETDYRDQRNLTVTIMASAAPAFVQRFGEPDHLIGRQIVVDGEARRVRIDFMSDDGRPSGKYYYQTHVYVQDVAQLSARQ